ncbi:hypothetical protein [uncultured Eudoraea sp.]|uniref:hypothetical protein n=1 Tax=uncultured Eudoraea sp. TaxID=1035614 RepID=UPI002611F3AC|nr:hypothetical protein [uncultured Eudoraea sp.]
MDLEEIQKVWSDMTDQLEKQKKLNNELIMKMTQHRFKSKFDKIKLYETIGAVICFIMAIFILFNLNKLDTWYLLACGLFTVAFLLVLPVITLGLLGKIQRMNIVNNSYKDAIVKYTKAKNQLLLMQRVGIYLSFVLMFTSLPVFSKIMKNKDLFINSQIWLAYIPVMIIFLVLFTRWGYKCYKNITNSAENILKELEA